METSPGYTTGFNGGVLLGNQNSPRANYGYDSFVRPQRLVVSYVYNLPHPDNRFSLSGRVLGGWSVAGVTTFQSGQLLTITDINLTNAFGITSIGGGDGDRDRAEIAPGCTYGTLATSGSVNDRLNGYFNAACVAVPPVITGDGGTGFGNSGNGILRGPDQRDFDIALIKATPWGRSEQRNIEFRAEFFNAFNTPSFANPITSAGTIAPDPLTGAPVLSLNPSFGQILGSSVNPRIIQLALKLNF